MADTFSFHAVIIEYSTQQKGVEFEKKTRREYRSKGSCSIYFSEGFLQACGSFYYIPLHNKESEVMHGVLQKHQLRHVTVNRTVDWMDIHTLTLSWAKQRKALQKPLRHKFCPQNVVLLPACCLSLGSGEGSSRFFSRQGYIGIQQTEAFTVIAFSGSFSCGQTSLILDNNVNEMTSLDKFFPWEYNQEPTFNNRIIFNQEIQLQGNSHYAFLFEGYLSINNQLSQSQCRECIHSQKKY